ncbi:MAG: membrane protein insertion efficiency factor YidD [Fastidiosipilaceae bacterium]|nr:membrane protein insertion efficiency factor YidD [Clostridiaceae bacterium]
MKEFCIKMIRQYQRIFARPTSTCKYVPRCSEYAIDAITKYGALRGILLGGWRILRCNPFSKGGYDPVP